MIIVCCFKGDKRGADGFRVGARNDEGKLIVYYQLE